MQRFDAHRMGIVQGSALMFSDFEDDGPMWAGTGPREARSPVVFETPFAVAPSVIVNVGMWDVDPGSILRTDLRAENVTAWGCEIVFRTWNDTRIARLRVDWTAIGAVADDDLWEV